MWSLYKNSTELRPLVFSNGKSQQDVVKEVLKAVGQGHKIIFIRGMCGTGKSAIALNLAKEFGKSSIVVPIKTLQEQYIRDYTDNIYVLKNNNEKLKISPIVGRMNFKCKFLEQSGPELFIEKKEADMKLTDIFEGKTTELPSMDESCDNNLLPCKIEIKEKNINKIRQYIKENPDVNLTDFDSIKDVRRMSVAPICPYWCPIVSDEYEIRRFQDIRKIKYKGLNNKSYIIYQRRKGCPYYDQYESYADSDVILFNSSKYKLENLMDRKPLTELEIIDEGDEFLDSFANQEQINLNRLLFSLNMLFPENQETQKVINDIIDITNTMKRKHNQTSPEPLSIKNTLISQLLETVLDNYSIFDSIETEDSSYIFHLQEVVGIFANFLDETFFSVEKRENDLVIHLVTTNLAKKLKELKEKNKILVFMSGTVHSESVLRSIFGLEDFKVIEAETQHQGKLIKCKHGYEIDCKYENFRSNKITREQYLLALSKCVSCAKPPILVHVNSFSDLPTMQEKIKLDLENLPTQDGLILEQNQDPLGKRITTFRDKKMPILFTTKCSRGVDFPGDICNSIILTKFPYPNISSIFWKILKKTHPAYFMGFYMDKAQRELLQKIYRGLRSSKDKVYLLSPDIRVLDFEFD